MKRIRALEFREGPWKEVMVCRALSVSTGGRLNWLFDLSRKEEEELSSALWQNQAVSSIV